MNLNNGAVDECVFKVGVADHAVEKILEYASFGPATETPELAVPVAESGRQVAPWRAGSNPPKNCFQEQAIIFCRGDIAKSW